MGAKFGLSFICLAAIETGSQRGDGLSPAGDSGEFLSFIPGENIDREDNKQDQKNSHRP